MHIDITTHSPDPSLVALSRNRAAAVLEISTGVLGKGLDGGTIPDLTMGTIADLAARPIISSLVVGDAPVPVLRPGVAAPDPDDATRPFFGWRIDAPVGETLAGLDRWWTPPGRDRVLDAGGFVVAVGSIVCAVVSLRSDELETNAVGKIRYDARMAGLLRSDGTMFVDEDAGDWAELARRTLGLRVLGGRGGNFTEVRSDDE